MLNLDERYHSYLHGDKRLRIDGGEEKVIAYGWHCDKNDIQGYYITTEKHKLFYNMKEQFVRKEPLKELQRIS